MLMDFNFTKEIYYRWVLGDTVREMFDNEHFYPQIWGLTRKGGLTYSEILDMPLPMLKGYTAYVGQQLQAQQAEIDKIRKKRK